MAADQRLFQHFYAHCVTCGSRFDSLGVLGLHVDICGSRSTTPILCGQCGEIFESYKLYSTHANHMSYHVMYSDIPGYNGTPECVQHLIDAYGPVESIPKRGRPKQFRIAPYPQHRPAHTTQIRNIQPLPVLLRRM